MVGIVALLVVLIVGMAFFALVVVGIYNGLVTKRNRYKNAYVQIDIQLKRRYDLIPNLVETAKGYLHHERETLEAVIAARNSAMAASQRAAADPGNQSAMGSLGAAEATLASTLGRLMVVSEAYPDLKGNQNMMQLSEELTSTENKIAFARQAYNDAIMDYNTARERMPAVVFAGAMGFTEAAQLEVIQAEQERNAPKVSFSSDSTQSHGSSNHAA
jgi:LemA protein